MLSKKRREEYQSGIKGRLMKPVRRVGRLKLKKYQVVKIQCVYK